MWINLEDMKSVLIIAVPNLLKSLIFKCSHFLRYTKPVNYTAVIFGEA